MLSLVPCHACDCFQNQITDLQSSEEKVLHMHYFHYVSNYTLHLFNAEQYWNEIVACQGFQEYPYLLLIQIVFMSEWSKIPFYQNVHELKETIIKVIFWQFN